MELPLLEHLSVQFFEDRLTIQVTPAAGVAATPAAVELLQRICHHLTRHQILHRVMAPGQQGSPIEAVLIPLPRTG